MDKRLGEMSLSQAGSGTLEVGSVTAEAKFERMFLISFVEIN